MTDSDMDSYTHVSDVELSEVRDSLDGIPNPPVLVRSEPTPRIISTDDEQDSESPPDSSMDDREGEEKDSKMEVAVMTTPEFKIPVLGENWQEKKSFNPVSAIWPYCPRCNWSIKSIFKFCSNCGHQYSLPTGTIDLKETKFKLPDIVSSTILSNRTVDPFEVSPPNVFGSGKDVTDNYELNQSVFNHLPLKQEQKDKLLKDLTADALKLKSLKRVQHVGTEVRRDRRHGKKKYTNSSRSCVKDIGRECCP